MIKQQAVRPDVLVELLIESAIKFEKSSIQRSERKPIISSSDSELVLTEKTILKNQLIPRKKSNKS